MEVLLCMQLLVITQAGRHQVIKWARCFFVFCFGVANFAFWMLIGLRPDDTFFVVC